MVSTVPTYRVAASVLRRYPRGGVGEKKRKMIENLKSKVASHSYGGVPSPWRVYGRGEGRPVVMPWGRSADTASLIGNDWTTQWRPRVQPFPAPAAATGMGGVLAAMRRVPASCAPVEPSPTRRRTPTTPPLPSRVPVTGRRRPSAAIT